MCPPPGHRAQGQALPVPLSFPSIAKDWAKGVLTAPPALAAAYEAPTLKSLVLNKRQLVGMEQDYVFGGASLRVRCLRE